MFNLLTSIVTWIITVAGFGSLIWFMKRRFDQIDAKQEAHDKAYHACREELPSRFAAKRLAEDNFSETFERLRTAEKNIETHIAYQKGLQNGCKGS